MGRGTWTVPSGGGAVVVGAVSGPGRRRRLAAAFAMLSVVTTAPVAARRPSRKQVCRQECGAAIDACVLAGQRKAPCRRRTLKLCRKHGPATCEVTTSTIPSASTTTTIVFTTTTSTLPTPSGEWRFVGDVDADTCGDETIARALRTKLWGSAETPAHIDFAFFLLSVGPVDGTNCTPDPASQRLTCRDELRGVFAPSGLDITADATFEGGPGNYLAYDWTTADVPPFGSSAAVAAVCTGIGTAEQCCAQWELEARRPETCSPTTGTCTPDGDFSDGTATFTFSVGCMDATAGQTCRPEASFCGCRMHWSGKTAHASVIG